MPPNYVGPRHNVLDGGQDTYTRREIVGVAWHTEKHCESLLWQCGVRSKKITESSITARHAMRPFIKIL